MRPRICFRRRSVPLGKAESFLEVDRGERAWLAAILRRRVVRPLATSRAAADAADGCDDRASAGSASIRWQTIIRTKCKAALDGLAPELKETLLLVVVGELTHQEAAEVLNVPLGTVLSRVSRARSKLRDLLLAQNGAVKT